MPKLMSININSQSLNISDIITESASVPHILRDKLRFQLFDEVILMYILFWRFWHPTLLLF